MVKRLRTPGHHTYMSLQDIRFLRYEHEHAVDPICGFDNLPTNAIWNLAADGKIQLKSRSIEYSYTLHGQKFTEIWPLHLYEPVGYPILKL